MNHPIEQKYFTATSLAEMLDVHPETIRRVCDKGELFSYRIGSDRRIPMTAVEEWMNGRAVGQNIVAFKRKTG
jgi:excisionase family DNA binding protein